MEYLRDLYRRLIGDKWSELYALRALGVAMIVFRHSWVFAGFPAMILSPAGLAINVSGFFSAAVLGTTIVFVLAGFLNHLTYERAHLRGQPQPAIVPLLIRRLVRVVPVYYAVVLAGIILSGGLRWIALPNALLETLMTFTFTHSFLAAPQHDMIGANWAVQAVVQFYVLSPLISRLLLRRRWMIVAVLLYVLVVLYRVYIIQPGLDTHFLEHQLLPRLDHFLAGMLVAKWVAWTEVSHNRPRIAQWCGAVGLVLGILVLIMMADPGSLKSVISIPWLFGRMAFAIASACAIVYLLLAPRGLVHRITTYPPLVAFGLIGYSVFMWHLMLFRAFGQRQWYLDFAAPERVWFNLTAGIALTLAVSLVSFVVLEMPILLRRRKRPMRSASVTTP